MRVIVHLPKDENTLRELQRKIAVVHAEFVISKLNSLSLSYEDKLKILDALNKERFQNDY